VAYVIKKGAGVWRPVRWDEAVDGGDVAEAQIRVKFRRVGIEEASELNQLAAKGALPMLEFAKRVALDWDGLAGPDGKPVAFTPDTLAELLDVPGFPPALELAFWQMVGGMADERVKNSPASPAGGPAAGEATADQPPGTTA
jgi:hypothetical protein